MAKCIFCENELAEDTKPEHILLNSLGGRKTTTAVDCSACNGTFGSTIDDEVGQQVAVLRNMLQFDSPTATQFVLPRGRCGDFVLAGSDILSADPIAVAALEPATTPNSWSWNRSSGGPA